MQPAPLTILDLKELEAYGLERDLLTYANSYGDNAIINLIGRYLEKTMGGHWRIEQYETIKTA